MPRRSRRTIALLLGLFLLALPLLAAPSPPAKASPQSAWGEALAAIHTFFASILPVPKAPAPARGFQPPAHPTNCSGMDPDGRCL